MIFSIHQPCYFPWLGLLSKIAGSDTLIILNDVQLSDSAFQHRNQFLTKEGKIKYLTIPFVKHNYLHLPFKEVKIADPAWGTTHRDFLVNNYKKHPFFDEIYPAIDPLFSMESMYLIDIVLRSMEISLHLCGIQTKLMMQDQLPVHPDARKSELVVQLLKAAQATTYLSGTGAKSYQDDADFESEGITLNYARFKHPAYPQKNSVNFISGLSCLDLLFNVGVEKASGLINPAELIDSTMS